MQGWVRWENKLDQPTRPNVEQEPLELLLRCSLVGRRARSCAGALRGDNPLVTRRGRRKSRAQKKSRPFDGAAADKGSTPAG